MINSDNVTRNTTSTPPQIQDQEIASSQSQNEISAVFTASVSEQSQAGYKRFRTEEDSNEQEHLSKKVKTKIKFVVNPVDNLAISVYMSQISLNIDVPRYILAREDMTEAGQWSLVVESLLAYPKTITEINNNLITNGKEIEFLNFLADDVISEKDKNKILSFIIKDHAFWEDLEDNDDKKEYFLKLFNIEDAFQNGALADSLKIFIKKLSTSAMDWFMSSIEDLEEVRKGLRFNYHHILLALFSHKKLATEYKMIFRIHPEVNLFELAKKILIVGSPFDENTESMPYEEHIFLLLMVQARRQRNNEFLRKFGMKACNAFPSLCKTTAVIDTLLAFSLNELQNQIRLKAVPTNLLTYMHTPECEKITKECNINRDKLMDQLHFISMPCEEPSNFSLSFYQQLLRYQQRRIEEEPNYEERCLSISVIIALKESQIKMTKAFESVFYALDAHATSYYLPEEIKYLIAMEVLRSERPLSSVPKKMLHEKRMQWIERIPPRLLEFR